MHADEALLTVALATAVGIFAQLLSHRWRIPAIVPLLAIGVLLGPSVLGFVRPDTLGSGLSVVVKLAVAVILFDGALNLRLSDLRRAIHEVRSLVTVGVLVTWIGAALAARYIAGLSWGIAIVFGALVTVTGPTVIQPMLKRVSLPRQVRTTLEGEAILGDPIGAVLAVAVFDLVLGFAGVRSIGILSGAWAYLGRLIIGLCTGIAGAFALSRLLKLPRVVPAELANLVALAFVWLVFAVAESIQSESGIMAAVAMGLALQRGSVPDERRLRQFKEQLTVLGISIVFVLLAADLPLAVLRAEGWRGLLTVIALMLIVRPANVIASLRRSKLTAREKAYIAWIAPRGIVAASVASIFALTLDEAGMAEGSRLLAITFLTIALTVAIQGLTAAGMARLLGLASLMGQRAIIVGVGPLGRGLAAILRDHGRPVVLIDRNSAQVEHARALGFDAVVGNALDESVLELAGGDETETLVAVTSNPEVNTLAALLAHETFGVRRAFPALAHPSRGAGAQLADRVGARMAFARPLDVRAWEYEIEYGDAHFLELPVPPQWVGRRAGDIDLPQNVVAVAQLHDSSIEVVHPQLAWQRGDVAILLSTLSAEDVWKLLETATRDARSAVRPGDTIIAP